MIETDIEVENDGNSAVDIPEEKRRQQCKKANVAYVEYLRRRSLGFPHELALRYNGDPDNFPSVLKGYTVGQLKKICSQHGVLYAVYLARRRAGFDHERALSMLPGQ